MSAEKYCRAYPDVPNDGVVRYTKQGHSGDIETWGTYASKLYYVTFVIHQRKDGYHRMYCAIQKVRNNYPKIACSILFVFWLTLTWILGSDKISFQIATGVSVLFLLHVKYLELWYPQYSGDLIKAEKTFAVYKNMNLNELRKTIQSALYMFDIKSWPDTGPSWVKSEDAQTIFPFSAVVTIPELFHNCADEGGEIKRFRLPDTIVTPLYMNNVPFVEFRRAWKSMSKDLFQSVENMMSWVMSNWLALVVVIAVSSEMLNIGFIIAGMEEWTGNVGMVILRRLLAGLSTMVTEPLRTLYRQGPSFNTAYGDVGFWSNRHLSDVCSSMMPRFDRSFWEDNMRKCEQEYDAREEGFVMIVVISFIFLGIYKVIPRLR